MERDILRRVKLGDTGYSIMTYDTHQPTFKALGHTYTGYEFYDPDGKVLFAGEDFSRGASYAEDSDETVRSLLAFMTLREGDTDSDYFDDYTPEQLAFAENEAEALQGFGTDDKTEWEFYPLIDADITDCPEGADSLDQLCQMIARGTHDIDLKDFQARMKLEDDWDWGDVHYLIKAGTVTASEVDDMIHQGLS